MCTCILEKKNVPSALGWVLSCVVKENEVKQYRYEEKGEIEELWDTNEPWEEENVIYVVAWKSYYANVWFGLSVGEQDVPV